jgi:hypothetical protein
MINRITAVANEALRERWSTVAILTVLLTAGKAYSAWGSAETDLQSYLAQVFFALVISFVFSLAIHVILFLIFSPKNKPKKPSEPVVQTPVKAKEEHEAMIVAVHQEIEAVRKADAAAQGAPTTTQETKSAQPIDLHKELGVPKRAAKPSRKTSSRKNSSKRNVPKKKAASKKK